ncbi:MAG: hypothetical protein Q7S09_05930 [bacterium]|nr:hypothetical protein [bacterium]
MNVKKVILWIACTVIAIILLAIGAFRLLLYFTMETPKDNDMIERNLLRNAQQ